MAYEQSAFKRTMPKQTGFVRPKLNRPKLNKGGFDLGSLGGMLSGFAGGGNVSQYGEQNIGFQSDLRDDIYDKTTIDVTGPGYKNQFDADGNLISELTGVNKDIYDQSGNLTTMFGNQMMDYNSGGFEAMEQRRLERMRALTSEDNERRAQQIRERNLNTGASSYGVMQGQLAENNYLNQQDLGYQNNAFLQAIEGGQYLSGQRGQSLDQMLNSSKNANSMLANQMSKVNAVGNVTALAESGTMLADQQAAAAEAKSKGKNKFWAGIANMVVPGAGSLFG